MVLPAAANQEKGNSNRIRTARKVVVGVGIGLPAA